MPNQQNSEERPVRPRPSPEPSDMLAMWLLTFSQVFHQEIGELAAMAYKDALKNFTAQQIDRGCREVLTRCTFWPKPAEILRAIQDTAPLPQFPQLPEAGMTNEEAKEFFSKIREGLGWTESETKIDDSKGVVVITDEMRAEYERKKAEALKRFGT